MDRIQAIKNRTLSHNDLAKIQAMASVSEMGHAPVLSELKGKTEGNPAVDDVAFYGPRVMEFYTYFSNLGPPSVAATLALAAATLKACVVVGQAITDAHSIVIPAIPVKAENPAIPVKKKRGRPPKVK